MILALSPHLGDAVFSAGGTLAARAAAGEDVVLATAFTVSVPDPEGFALAYLAERGFVPGTDYMAGRRDEDRAAAERLGLAQTVHLPLPEAPHRGYGSLEELFAAPREDDLVHQHLATAVARLVDRFKPDGIFAPQGLGGHVDHVQLVRALELAEVSVAIARWRDVPHVIHEESPVARGKRVVPIGPTLRDKLDAAAAYTSQLGFEFGGEEAMRTALTALAEREGDGVPAERFAA